MVEQEVRHRVQRVRRMAVAVGAAEAGIDLVAEGIGHAVEEGTGLGEETGPEEGERRKVVAAEDRDCEMERRKAAVAEHILVEGVVEGSHAAVAAGRIDLEVDRPVAGRNLEEALVVVERRSPVVADIPVGDIDLAGVADSQAVANDRHSQDIHHLVGEDRTCCRESYNKLFLEQRNLVRSKAKQESVGSEAKDV